jgi:hypothetical protein
LTIEKVLGALEFHLLEVDRDSVVEGVEPEEEGEVDAGGVVEDAVEEGGDKGILDPMVMITIHRRMVVLTIRNFQSSKFIACSQKDCKRK